MNKRNFVYNYVMRKRDFDDLQGDAEDGINDLANTLAGKGIVSGLEVSRSGSDATVSRGIAFDGDGKRIELTSSAAVDMSSITRPGTGQFKWVTLVLRHDVANQGTVTDGHNQEWPLRLLDSYQIELLEGTAGTENGITKPTVSASQVPLIDIKVDESTPWASLTTESNRRPGPLVNILNVVYPVGYTYAQYPGGSTPSAMLWPGIWEAQFETEGVFFRTPGGQATAFGVGIQEDAMQDHIHFLSSSTPFYNSEGGGSNRGASGHPSGNPTTGSVSGSARTSSETRPRNRTFRTWKRTV